MKKIFAKCLLVAVSGGMMTLSASAQTTQQQGATVVVDTALVPSTGASVNDSLPIQFNKKSLRNDGAVEKNLVKDRTPLPYEHIREDDAVYMQRIWRDIDAREKINQPFVYKADEDDGNQRFISILLKAIQDGPDNGGVTAFANTDDRFTTPMTIPDVARMIAGEPVLVPIYGEGDNASDVVSYKEVMPEVNLDSFYKFRIKEEVIFDKESSRLVWRILGIAPLKNMTASDGTSLGESELFWIYYPDLRPILAKYEVYNGKNYGARMSWEELFESRMFYGRIVKSTLDNPGDLYIKDQLGFKNSNILQLLEGENIKDKVFNYEQNLWSY